MAALIIIKFSSIIFFLFGLSVYFLILKNYKFEYNKINDNINLELDDEVIFLQKKDKYEINESNLKCYQNNMLEQKTGIFIDPKILSIFFNEVNFLNTILYDIISKNDVNFFLDVENDLESTIITIGDEEMFKFSMFRDIIYLDIVSLKNILHSKEYFRKITKLIFDYLNDCSDDKIDSTSINFMYYRMIFKNELESIDNENFNKIDCKLNKISEKNFCLWINENYIKNNFMKVVGDYYINILPKISWFVGNIIEKSFFLTFYNHDDPFTKKKECYNIELVPNLNDKIRLTNLDQFQVKRDIIFFKQQIFQSLGLNKKNIKNSIMNDLKLPLQEEALFYIFNEDLRSIEQCYDSFDKKNKYIFENTDDIKKTKTKILFNLFNSRNFTMFKKMFIK